MKRDFEQEFRELKQNEIPDLWNRIEAGLSEKKNMTTVPENVTAIDNGYAAERGSFGKRDDEKGTVKKPFAWRTWGTLIAACLCVIIIFPAFSLLIRNKSYSGGDTAADTSEAIAEDNAVADTALEESAESGFGMNNTTETASEAAAEAEVPESAEGMADNAVTADAGGFDLDSAKEAAADASTDTTAASEDTEPELTVENTQKNDAAVSRKEDEKAAWDDLADGQILEDAAVQIQKAETAGGETLYQASVKQADADNILECGMQIALVCDDDTEYAFFRGPRDEKELEEQETYQVTLRYDAEAGMFVVLTADSWEE